jgi:hypothetical protein
VITLPAYVRPDSVYWLRLSGSERQRCWSKAVSCSEVT